jgi:hypothetical protein
MQNNQQQQQRVTAPSSSLQRTGPIHSGANPTIGVQQTNQPVRVTSGPITVSSASRIPQVSLPVPSLHSLTKTMNV